MGSKYTEEDAARDTKTTVGNAKRAWHQARNDAQDSGEKLDKRDRSKK